jgi:glycosyltransferase involved in cell wall biosynthesis
MAGLALGLPIVTTEGRHSEPLWRQSGAVEFVPTDDPDQLVRAAERLLRDPRARANLGKAARLVYEREFALQRTVERLRVGASRCLERGLHGRP